MGNSIIIKVINYSETCRRPVQGIILPFAQRCLRLAPADPCDPQVVKVGIDNGWMDGKLDITIDQNWLYRLALNELCKSKHLVHYQHKNTN